MNVTAVPKLLREFSSRVLRTFGVRAEDAELARACWAAVQAERRAPLGEAGDAAEDAAKGARCCHAP
ncbi:MAG TPA: hypothetical protein VEX86_28820, partial [Longimicrobium sp.]|nr:hypothetical protein [Longimicrobium sp.]